MKEIEKKKECVNQGKYTTCINPNEFVYRGCTDKCRYYLQPLAEAQEQSEREEPLIGFPKPSDRDWAEDFSHENGNYTNKCFKCGEHFTGHKRRVICKLCDKIEQPKDGVKESQSAEEIKRAINHIIVNYWNEETKATELIYLILRPYAEQYHQDRIREELRDELILFCCDCNVKLPEDKDYIDLVDNYLKNK